jgi:hypothetical protein
MDDERLELVVPGYRPEDWQERTSAAFVPCSPMPGRWYLAILS